MTSIENIEMKSKAINNRNGQNRKIIEKIIEKIMLYTKSID